MSELAIKVPSFKKSLMSQLDQDALSSSVLMTFAQAIEAVCSQYNVFGLREIGLNILERASSQSDKLGWTIPMIRSQYLQVLDETKVQACHNFKTLNVRISTDQGELGAQKIYQELKQLAPLARDQVSSGAQKRIGPIFKVDDEGNQSIFSTMAISAASLCVRIVYERRGREKPKECDWMNDFAAAVCAEFLLICSLVDSKGWPE